MIQLNYRDSKPIYEQIKDGLRRLVVTGAIKKDEKFPSVRELATSLSINPNTIQKASRFMSLPKSPVNPPISTAICNFKNMAGIILSFPNV